MTMKKIYLSLLILLSVLSFGQKQQEFYAIDMQMSKIPSNLTYSTSKIASYINANFNNDNDKIRAIFYWTASSISYDINNLFAPVKKEFTESKISNTLRTRKGVCSDYTEIFNDIANKVGIKTIIISGYTKQNGVIDTLSHAWCASKINNKWYLYDPTWASGYVNNGRFVKKMDNKYYKLTPAQIIVSHIPFDYLWQFLNYPITNQEFYEGNTQINKSKKYFDYERELAQYESKSELDKLYDSAERIEQNGIANQMILDRLKNKDKNISYLHQKENIAKLNSITRECNEAIDLLNEFISYRNRKFSPALPDYEIKKMIEKPKQKLMECQNALYKVGYIGKENTSSLNSLKRSVDNALAQTEQHLQYVQSYISKRQSATKRTIY